MPASSRPPPTVRPFPTAGASATGTLTVCAIVVRLIAEGRSRSALAILAAWAGATAAGAANLASDFRMGGYRVWRRPSGPCAAHAAPDALAVGGGDWRSQASGRTGRCPHSCGYHWCRRRGGIRGDGCAPLATGDRTESTGRGCG